MILSIFTLFHRQQKDIQSPFSVMGTRVILRGMSLARTWPSSKAVCARFLLRRRLRRRAHATIVSSSSLVNAWSLRCRSSLFLLERLLFVVPACLVAVRVAKDDDTGMTCATAWRKLFWSSYEFDGSLLGHPLCSRRQEWLCAHIVNCLFEAMASLVGDRFDCWALFFLFSLKTRGWGPWRCHRVFEAKKFKIFT